jgi:hypothetical protein
LTHADRLDDHDVEAGRFAHEHRLTGAARHPTERSSRRRRSNERPLLPRELFHACLVAEDRTAGARAGRIDREHCDAMTLLNEPHAQSLDERRLPGTGRAADPDPSCAARVRHQFVEQRRGFIAMIRPRRFHERDRACERSPITLANLVEKFCHAARRWRTKLRISDAARGMLLPGPNTAATPFDFKKS